MNATLSTLSHEESIQVGRLVADFLTTNGVRVERVGMHSVHVQDGRTFGLDNVASRCAQAHEFEWRAIVADHFGALLRVGEQPPTLSTEAILSSVCLRLVPGEAFPGCGVRAESYSYARDLGGDLYEVIASVDGGMVRWLRDCEVEQAGGTDVLRPMALERLRAVEFDVHEEEEGILVLSGQSGFIASQVLRLGELVPEATLLVGVPNRYTVVLANSPQYLPTLQSITLAEHATGVAPVSRSVFLFRGGRFERLS